MKGQWPLSRKHRHPRAREGLLLRLGELEAEVRVTCAPQHQRGNVVWAQRVCRPARVGLRPFLGAVVLQHCVPGVAVEVVVHRVDEGERQRALLAALRQGPEGKARRGRHEELTGDGRLPDAREDVPLVVHEHAGVDEHDALDPVRMARGPLDSPRPAQVVQHEVSTLDAELRQRGVEEPDLSRHRVLEVARLVGLPEAGHVEGHRARERAGAADQVPPVGRGAGIAVEEHDRLARFARPCLQHRSAESRDGDAPLGELAFRCGGRLHQRVACHPRQP